MFLKICVPFLIVSVILSLFYATSSEASVKLEDHIVDGEHNPEFDRQAFLGEEASAFEQLSPDQIQERLKKLVENKIDTDKDGSVSEEELTAWISKTSKQYIENDVDRNWKAFDRDDGKGLLTWLEYLKRTYGFENQQAIDESGLDKETIENYRNMIRRDKERWVVADADEDDLLNLNEYRNFLHPELEKSMHEILVKETMDDLDRDKDGKVSMDEYLDDVYPELQDMAVEPDWVLEEKKSFARWRDTDKDGFLDEAEVRQWILPSDMDFVTSEVKHLINIADNDRNGALSIEEILENADSFAGSQATDFGEHLRHEEL